MKRFLPVFTIAVLCFALRLPADSVDGQGHENSLTAEGRAAMDSGEWQEWYKKNAAQARGVMQKAVEKCISAGLSYPDSRVRTALKADPSLDIDTLPKRLLLRDFFKKARHGISEEMAELLVQAEEGTVPEKLPEGFLESTPDLLGDVAYVAGASHITRGFDLVTCIENGMVATLSLWYETIGRKIERQNRIATDALSRDRGAGGNRAVLASECAENLDKPCKVDVSIQCNTYVPFLQPDPIVVPAEGICVAATRVNICQLDSTRPIHCTSRFGWKYRVEVHSYSGLDNVMNVKCPGTSGFARDSVFRNKWKCELEN